MRRPYFNAGHFLIASICFVPAIAAAYVGPGAGLTMLGSLWGLILAIVFVVFGLLILPVKLMRNRMKERRNRENADEDKEQGEEAD